MSPLGFDSKKMYNFVARNFTDVNVKVQEQALNWLQTLTMLGITIPLSLIFSMFRDGISIITNITQVNNRSKENNRDRLNGFEDPLMCTYETLQNLSWVRHRSHAAYHL